MIQSKSDPMSTTHRRCFPLAIVLLYAAFSVANFESLLGDYFVLDLTVQHHHASNSSDLDFETEHHHDIDLGELIPTHHLCRAPNLTVHTQDGSNQTFKIGYHCEGPFYDNFTQDLWTFIESNNSTTWGKRKYPLPTNKSVVAIGNSHMRQSLTALVCQHADVITHARMRFSRRQINHLAIRFDNNSTLTWVVNSRVEIAKDWEKVLRDKYTHKPLTDFDGVLLGQFNNGGGMHGDLKNTSYYRTMMNLSKHDDGLDLDRKPPNILDVAKAFSDGPVVFATNYDTSGKTQRYVQNVEKLVSVINEDENTTHHDDSRFRVIQARKYFPMLNNNECGSGDFDNTFWCHPKAGMSHRCTGEKGGHPDLIAFDIVETFHELFVQQQRRSAKTLQPH